MHTQEHYTITELAKMWKLSYSTIQRMFRGEPGVLHLGNIHSRRRTRISLRIPADVAEKVHQRLGSQNAA